MTRTMIDNLRVESAVSRPCAPRPARGDGNFTDHSLGMRAVLGGTPGGRGGDLDAPRGGHDRGTARGCGARDGRTGQRRVTTEEHARGGYRGASVTGSGSGDHLVLTT